MTATSSTGNPDLVMDSPLQCTVCRMTPSDGNSSAAMKFCSPCRRANRKVAYCSRECQITDWKYNKHKSICASSSTTNPNTPTPTPAPTSTPKASASALSHLTTLWTDISPLELYTRWLHNPTLPDDLLINTYSAILHFMDDLEERCNEEEKEEEAEQHLREEDTVYKENTRLLLYMCWAALGDGEKARMYARGEDSEAVEKSEFWRMRVRVR